MVLRIAVQPQPCGGGVRSMACDFPSGAAFGLCYMMTITFQTICALKMGRFQSLIWQGLLCTLYSGALPYFRCVGYPPFAARRWCANCFFVSLLHETHETDGIKDDGSNCRQIGKLVFEQLNIPFGEINSWWKWSLDKLWKYRWNYLLSYYIWV